MNLSQLTAYIGEKNLDVQKDEFQSAVQQVKSLKQDEQAYIVSMVFDFQSHQINFELYSKFSRNSPQKYYYFGNNDRASFQYYLVRDIESLHYLLTSSWNDLYRTLIKFNLQNGELGEMIKQLESKNFITLGKRKGEGSVNLRKISILQGKEEKNIVLDKSNKRISINNQTYNFEDFVRLLLDDKNKKDRFVLVLPIIRFEDGKEVILSTHPDYLEIVRRDKNLGEVSLKNPDEKVCYICHQYKKDVSIKYSTKFKYINKIFTTTTINASPYSKNYNYDYSYSMCSECYRKLFAGEKVIFEQFKGRLAEEDVFIIPEGLLGTFDYKLARSLKDSVDLAFYSKEANEWLEDIEFNALFNKVKQYSLNFVIYRGDGKSINILETIEDVPMLRFQKIMKLIGTYVEQCRPHIHAMSLSFIYRMVPVRVNKRGEQLEIGKVLTLYKAILSGEMIRDHVLYDYAVDAFDKGMRQLGKEKIDNYYNMGLINYANGKEDFFIKNIVMQYLILFKLCRELNILSERKMKDQKGREWNLKNDNHVSESIEEMEQFLDYHEYSDEARALFYLGILINQVAIAQYKKGHKNKPILKKVPFQGLKRNEIHRLYNDVIEKLQQYEKINSFTQSMMKQFHHYCGSLEKPWNLTEQANVFYIMSGYSYPVGTKMDESNEEQQDIEDIETI